MYELINGKEVAEHIKQQVKNEIENLGLDISLAVVVVGNDPASKIYVNNKKKACEFVGIKSLEYNLPEETSEAELLNLIDYLNLAECVHGVLVQLPLPAHINKDKVLERISPEKDVDGFTSINTGKLWLGNYDIAPCTAMGICSLLSYYNIDVKGKKCAIIGRSQIVGKPVAAMLLERNATVIMCHSHTKNLEEITRNSDIIIVAAGKRNLLTADMVSPGAVVIDVGVNRDENNKICGDSDFEGLKDIVSAITPPIGGVGPMTIAMLMKNTLIAAKNQCNRGD